MAYSGLSGEIQSLRYEVYHNNRMESLDLVRSHRKQLIRENWKPPVPKKKMMTSQSAGQLEPIKRTVDITADRLALQKKEEDRIQKILYRQQKEMENMVAYELQLARSREKQERKAALRKKKEEAERKARKEEAARAAEKRQAWSVQKAAEEKEKLEQRVKEEEIRRRKEENFKACTYHD